MRFVLYAKFPQSAKAGEKLGEPLPPGRYAISITNRCDDKGQLLSLGIDGDLGQFGEGGVEVAPLWGVSITVVFGVPFVEASRRQPDPLQAGVSCWTEG